MTSPLHRARSSPVVRRVAQAVILCLLVFAVISSQRSADDVRALKADGKKEHSTAKVVSQILADTCGAADFKTLKREGLLEECRLARQGEIDKAIKAQLPANGNDPDKVRENLTAPSAGSPAAGSIDAAVADWFASHDLSLSSRYTAALRNAVIATLRANPSLRGQNGKDATPQQIAAAASAYLVSHPPKDGVNGHDGRSVIAAALDGCMIVFTYSDGISSRVGPVCGKDGADGPPPTDEQVNAAVAAYCSEGDRCRGPQGEPGYPAKITLADGQTCTDPDGDHNYTCDPGPGPLDGGTP